MATRAKKRKDLVASAFAYDIDDLFHDGVKEEFTGDKAETKGRTPKTATKQTATAYARGEKELSPKKQIAKGRGKISPPKREGDAARWQPPRGFRIYSEAAAGPEYLRVHRKMAAPEVFDETLVKLLVHIPAGERHLVYCDGCLFPSAIAAAGGRSGLLQLGPMVDTKASEATRRLGGEVVRVEEVDKGVNLAVICYDHITGEKACEEILRGVAALAEGGILVACFPAEGLLDYSTNIRMEASNMRNKVHRLCKTHFILRTSGPLMQPAWDIIVLSQRRAQVNVSICKWRFTGSGVLPWQKCNEAFSSAPWLLVETTDQIAAALARCITYPWEPFGD